MVTLGIGLPTGADIEIDDPDNTKPYALEHLCPGAVRIVVRDEDKDELTKLFAKLHRKVRIWAVLTSEGLGEDEAKWAERAHQQ